MPNKPVTTPKPIDKDTMQQPSCPMERLFERVCVSAGISFQRDDQTKDGSQLDYYLPDYQTYVEVKQMHSPRIADQMSRRHNVIAIQGMDAMRSFGKMVGASIEVCNG